MYDAEISCRDVTGNVPTVGCNLLEPHRFTQLALRQVDLGDQQARSRRIP